MNQRTDYSHVSSRRLNSKLHSLGSCCKLNRDSWRISIRPKLQCSRTEGRGKWLGELAGHDVHQIRRRDGPHLLTRFLEQCTRLWNSVGISSGEAFGGEWSCKRVDTKQISLLTDGNLRFQAGLMAPDNLHQHRGSAIIVSIEKCKGRPRPRAVVDRKGMEEILKMLKFRVTIMESKSARGLRAELKNVINNIGDEPSDSFVCFVSAYGNTEGDDRQFILDQEGEKLYVVDDIIKPLMACKRLDGKPRVFFVNLCTWNFGMHPLNSGAGNPLIISTTKERRLKLLNDRKDLLAVFSTEEEHQAEQDLGNGTCFVPAFLQSLHRNHNNKPVVQIINEANYCQTISVTNTLGSELFWRTRMPEDSPGIVVPPDPVGKRLLQVYKTPDQSPELDVVLFHGYEFGGKGWYPAALSSWFTTSSKPVCWPVEWLPGELGLPMRVFCVKYSESVYNPEPCSSKRSLKELAEQVRKDLGQLLGRDPEGLSRKPLIFIAHGLGGLLIQEILNSKEGYVQRLNDRLRGIVFYGVPYDFRSGPKENFSLPALENALKQEYGYLSVMKKSEIEEAMDPNEAESAAIKNARRNFKKYKEITLSFEEGKETHGSKINLVAAQSYATQVNTIVESCLTSNHFDMCKPTTATEEMFTSLLRFIRKQLQNSDQKENVADVIVGQDAHREKLKKCLMARGTTAAAVAGITGNGTFAVAGMGGIGKTTLAKSLFEDKEIKEYYDHRVYWIAIKRKPSIVDCQRRLIYEICKEMPSVEFDTEELLRQELQRKLSGRKRVLLFLDDVWEKNDVDKLLGHSFMKTLPPESKCIITSRKPTELAKLDENAQIEKLDVLNNKDARTLFCSKAFLSRKMPTDKRFKEVVEGVIDACGHVPILLATVGAERWGKNDICSWEEVRDRLRVITAQNKADDESATYQNLIEQLMISYDDLPEGDPDSGDGINLKDFFLDFAAFPEREEIEIAVLMDMWTKPGLTEDGAYRILEELEQRCLVKIAGYWCYVHDIFRALAIKIVEKESLKKRKRLFSWGMSNSRLLEEWHLSEECEDGLMGDPVAFETETMVIARSGLEKFHPRDSILFKCLTRLRMLLLTSNLNLVSLPPEIGCLTSLEKLDLSWCLGLRELPREIGQLESLLKLNMAGCCSLTAIPCEIGKLKKLMELNMQSCGIVKLPEEIGELSSLTWLCLNDCNKLGVLPEAIGKLSSLVRLECDMLKISEIPKTFGNLSNLKYLSFGACHNMSKIPEEFVKLKNLVSLWCVNTRSLRVIPVALDQLAKEGGSLRVFNVYGTGVRWEHLPPNLRALPRPFDGTIRDPEADSTAENLDGPYWMHRRGMLVDTSSLYDPSNKDERRLSFGLVGVVTLAKMEPFLSQRFNMAIRIMYTMCNHAQTRHAILKYGGIPVLLRCVAEGDDGCSDYAVATLSNICVTPSTHKAIVDAQGLNVLTRALHRRDHVGSSAFNALGWIKAGDELEKDFTFTSEIYERCGHSFGHDGCACIWCQYEKQTFLSVKNIF
ncbi:hypothetical protein KC19_5G008700 [Ceratodon purpureus]|uniref:Caspase family p20 domain-containing protein n=1 Tax=Ceratodon purpureus TaxID=3225 RepID=A0A8T0HXY0_CERPU|nr:hypothetical protein KC19_5G008700 [Ceratodon purpureus]